MKITMSIALLLFLFSCNSKEHQIHRKSGIVDTGDFKITLPDNWEYIELKGFDSFIGKFTAHSNGEEYTLSFDFSHMGYVNSLIPSETEFIYDQQWQWMPSHYFIEPGIIYTSGDVETARKKEIKTKGITDSSLVKVEPIPKPTVKITKEYKDSTTYSYLAHLTYRDSTIIRRIDLPEERLKHDVLIDTIGHFRRKLVYPRGSHSGITGVYLKDLLSDLNLQINGKALPLEVREQAIEAFKSIEIK